MKQTVLIIEDEPNIINLLNAILESNGYKVLTAGRGNEGVTLAASHNPDVILLDLGLPDTDGISVIQKVRVFSAKPIIVVSAREHEREKVNALDTGADDYIVKPFGSSELLARIRAAVRHHDMLCGHGNACKTICSGDLVIDCEKQAVSVNGKMVHFTPIEYKIITLLGKYIGKVLTHDFIIKNVWGPYSSENQALRVNMANIRRKIEVNPSEPKYIITEVGVGYRMIDGRTD